MTAVLVQSEIDECSIEVSMDIKSAPALTLRLLALQHPRSFWGMLWHTPK